MNAINKRRINERLTRATLFCLLAFAAMLYSAGEARAQWVTNGTNINNTNTGNVGIGTTTPQQLLTIQKDQNSNTSLAVFNTADGPYAQIGLGASRTTDYSNKYFVLGVTAPSFTYPGFGETAYLHSLGLPIKIGTQSANDIHFFTNGIANTKFTIASGGNVGIGTTTPSALFTLRASSGDVVSRFSNAGGIGGAFDVRYKYESSQHRMGVSDANGQWMFYTQWAAANTDSVGFFPGKVGIGTSAPSTALHVVGDVTVTGNISAKYQDVAEWVPSREQLAAGTVVVVDAGSVNQVLASTAAYDTGVAGVISPQPGIALGERGEGKVLVATTGRVKVKVDATRFPVRAGDLLVTSEVAGVAMRSEPVSVGGVSMHRPGTIIGKALEPLEKGTGEILVLLSLQ